MGADTDELAAEAMPEEEQPGSSTAIEVVRAHTREVSRSIPTDSEINRLWRIASALAQSQMFPDAQQAAQAYAKILMGHDLGLAPTQAMTGIHIVEGKPQLHYATMGGFIKSREGYDYRVEKHTAEECEIAFLRDGEEIGRSIFSIADAKQAGLAFKDRRGNPTNWEKRPKVMLLARALSQGVRWFMPEVLGGVPVYVEGEIEAEANHVGAGGEPAGIDLGPKVEAVLARALRLRHMGLADRGSAELALGNQSPKTVDEWCAWANSELDKIDPDAERPDPEPEEKPEEEVDGEPVKEGENA